MSKWRRNLSKGKRWTLNALINRDGDVCYLCHRTFSKKGDITIDHLVPQAEGGTDELSNLRLAHLKCNQAKKNMSLEEFAVLQEGF